MCAARRLEKCVRKGDTVARIGGDEFTILVDDIDSDTQALRTAERVLEQLSQPIQLGDEEIRCSGSVGITMSGGGAASSEDLLRNADLALYRAKMNGRGRWAIYNDEMHQHAVATLNTETGLSKALDNDEIEPWFQPVCSVAGGAVVGFEALARWRSADGRIIMPSEFIPAAEESGSIVEIGHRMLEGSCRQLKIWREQGLTDRPVSVNVSVRQLHEPNFVQLVERVLADHNLPPSSLEIELTESALLEDRTSGAAVLKRLADLGVKIALDDFGEGYSSLSYLHRYRLDTLKISDRFVHEVCSNSTVAVITSGIIDLARNLGLRVVGEGVETQQQLDFLEERGCDAYQGALTSWALPADKMTAYLESEPQARAAPQPVQEVG